MVTSSLTWFFGLAQSSEISVTSAALPTTFLGLGIMLSLAFRDCQFAES